MKKLPSGNFRAQVFDHTELVTDDKGNLVLDENGDPKEKRVYKSLTAPTKTELKALVADYKANKRGEAQSIGLTLAEAFKGYLRAKNDVLSPATVRGYTFDAKSFDKWGNRRIDTITTIDVQSWVNELSRTLSPKTVRNRGSLLTTVLAFYNVNIGNIKYPQAIKPTYYVPTDDEVVAVVKYCQEHDIELLRAVYLAAYATLRRSEVCGLKASDIQGCTIHVREAKVEGVDDKFHEKTTKNTTSDRYIELPQFVIDVMPKEGAVFSRSPNALTCAFIKALDNLGIEHFRFHDLRHYSASIMHAIGIPDQYIMERGGWKTDTVLKQIYRGTLSDYQKKYSKQTNKYFEKINRGK